MCLQVRVAPDQGVVLGEVDGVVGPLLQAHDRQVRAVAHADLDTGVVLGGAGVLQDDGGAAVPTRLDDGVAVPAAGTGAGEAHDHGRVELGLLGDAHEHRPLRAGPGRDRGAVSGAVGAADPLVVHGQAQQLDALGRLGLHGDGAVGAALLGEQAGEAVDGREAPVLLSATGDGKVVHGIRGLALGPRLVGDQRLGGVGVGAGGGVLLGQKAHQPTAPSICSSIRRFSSRAYSMGSSRAMGSTNPRTIMAMASSSDMPRDMR